MNVRKLPSGTYEARLMVNGVRYTATLPTLEDAQDWITVVRAKAVTDHPLDRADRHLQRRA